MIKSIRLQNFFGFQDCTINLEKGENVLVGINGSGKSNFFKAIQVITYGILKNLNPIINKQWGGINNVINKCGNAKELAELTFEIVPGLTDGNQTLVYNIKIERLQNLNYKLFEYAVLRRENHADKAIYSYSDGLGKVTERTNHNDVELPFKIEFGSKELYLSTPLDEARFPDFTLLYEELSRVYFYSEINVSGYSDIRKSLPPIGDDELDEDGANLVQVLNYLKLSNRPVFKSVIDSLKKVNDSFEDIEFRNFSNQLELHLIEQGLNSSIPPQSISDGTLRFLCLMTALYSAKSGSVICIDEPELGLHPDMVNTLYRAIEHAAETSQIIISTHSPELLNHFNVENIRVFEKDENNTTIVNQYEVEQFDTFMNKYMPGQLWRQGHLGGNRW